MSGGFARAFIKIRFRYISLVMGVVGSAIACLVWPFADAGTEWLAVVALAASSGFAGMSVGWFVGRHQLKQAGMRW